jgi:hypothetical protein
VAHSDDGLPVREPAGRAAVFLPALEINGEPEGALWGALSAVSRRRFSLPQLFQLPFQVKKQRRSTRFSCVFGMEPGAPVPKTV